MSMGILWQWLLYGWVALEVIVALGTRTWRRKDTVRDRGTQLILWIVILCSFSAAERLAFPSTEMRFDHDALRTAAIVLIVLGLIIRISAIATLGKWFSANVAIRSSQTLKRNGLYGLVRHPSYLGMEIIFLACGLHRHNWASLAMFVVPPTLAVLYRIHVEETALLHAFGDDYAGYMRTTKRLIPRVF
jgi:protein-S-isoprenylcysteine O-methyltransferase Ste14